MGSRRARDRADSRASGSGSGGGLSFGDTDRNELIRLAAGTGADMEVVWGHAVPRELGGVGALLRYQHDAPTPAAV